MEEASNPSRPESPILITTPDLKKHPKAELMRMAKRLGVTADASMTKNALMEAIEKAQKATTPRSKGTRSAQRTTKSSAKAGTTGGTSKTASSAKVANSGKASKSGQAKVGTSRSRTQKSSQPSPSMSPTAKSKAAKKPTTKANAKAATGSNGSKGSAGGQAKAVEVRAKLKSPKSASPATKARSAKSPEKKVPSEKKSTQKKQPAPKKSTTSPQVLKKIRELQLQREASRDIGFRPRMVQPPGARDPVWEKEPAKDRVGVFVRDPYWLHVAWDITRNAVERAQAAMAEQWHGAKPMLRLLRLDDSGTSSASETVETDIEIRGGVRNWYIPWTGESATFRVLIGYLGTSGRFHMIAKSNVVKTPAASSSEAIDEHWSDLGAEGERIFALSGGYDTERETGELKEMLEERLHRTLGAPALAKLGASADGPFRRRGDFHFDMDIELVVYGSTVPDGYLTLNEEPVTLRPDGTFVVRLPFPDRRQVIPAVAVARDGSHQRTIVVAVERNTKIMEPLEQEQDTGE